MVALPVESWLPGMDITAGRLESMNQRAWLMVTNYGADPSGASNSDAAIQLALNDARDRGGAWVLVPPGTYLLGAMLKIYGNTRLTLMQGTEFRRVHSGTMLLNGDNGQSYGGYTGHSRITVEGGLWNMQGTTPGMTGNAMCMSFGHCSDILVRDLEVRDVPGHHALEFNSTSHGTITNCKFRGFIDPGGRDFSEAVQLDIAKGTDQFGNFGPYDNTPTEDVTISGCYFGASGTAGTTAWPRGIGSHAATIQRWHRRIRISDCAFEGVLQYGVSAYNWEDVTVSGNTFVSCGSSVRIRTVIKSDVNDTLDVNGVQTSASQNMRNISVTGNTMRAGGSYDNAIVALGETSGTILNLSIVGNTIDGTSGGESGIRLQYVSRATVGDNVVANADGTGISTENQDNTIVNNNVVFAANGNGITVVSGNNCSVLGNIVRDPGSNGILLQLSSDVQVSNNFVQGAGKATNATFWSIRLSPTPNANTGCTISGNVARPGSNTNTAIAGLSIANANDNTNIRRYGNDFRSIGGTKNWTAGVGAGLADLNTTQTSAVATDIS